MCQQLCLEILEKNNKWMTSREIHEKAQHISIGSVQCNMKKLIKHKLVGVKPSKKLTKTGVAIPVNKYKAK